MTKNLRSVLARQDLWVCLCCPSGTAILSSTRLFPESTSSSMCVCVCVRARARVCVLPLTCVSPCREISAAQDRFTDLLESIYRQQPSLKELTRMVMMTVGRGGEGDVGQRIRDEILVIQRANNCMGGMMEQWHQKLHNNTSPDDVVICEVRGWEQMGTSNARGK